MSPPSHTGLQLPSVFFSMRILQLPLFFSTRSLQPPCFFQCKKPAAAVFCQHKGPAAAASFQQERSWEQQLEDSHARKEVEAAGYLHWERPAAGRFSMEGHGEARPPVRPCSGLLSARLLLCLRSRIQPRGHAVSRSAQPADGQVGGPWGIFS